MQQNNNPCGLDGFAFLEFSGPDKIRLHQQFTDMGFQATANHKNQDITLFQQGEIQFIVNAASNCQAEEHAKTHGSGACAMGFRVKNAQEAFDHAIKHGAIAFEDCNHTHHGLPGIQAIGGSVIYFVDEQHQPFADHWQHQPNQKIEGNGLVLIDHLTHNVFRGNMDKWAHFYESIFNFQEIRYFNIKGKMTGLLSRALGSPCGKIKIPLNESKDDLSQIEEFLHEYKGEGIQHIALTTNNIYHTVHTLREQGVKFLDVPDTYYEMLHDRLPWHQEPVKQLNEEKILIDGEQDPKHGLLLQIFTENIFGPVFFEIIQRKGNQGFGEGNFQALFEAIERDQIKRGTLKETSV
ncbi:4-hydroxyphenylpyruvate dioxygenase [Legionella longbeachae]|uniref:4-hydroxyphenylpyruvate dioxygenase n=1 Tax=Legionella longbeachae serogroup 1 (strain NSW150) TaxID=661367 RepID=D3HPX2_LEGLN|nr:4-hydroxyphenylpyruvate dioxygenase [Legionella longbeachae]VEE01457.1 4-hydroxyphenylpyruvate dioxygenase [Legionella oakridgensis]HBD7396175.1 4-hydroxyphenylpyruvate dioxygenase [Legionella pneumophila]ARB92183.1 4-hydroxyphenylpyruvate dioxygenase [Legionella longbeachae]ARM34637.1 4-hydroxyphenylpyruvate dioxygenase [Legionella longbeachae]EEZ96062.1 4-hydroxyphenylpyruvate dioxygenase [Legionella longbeachae D-4968]